MSRDSWEMDKANRIASVQARIDWLNQALINLEQDYIRKADEMEADVMKLEEQRIWLQHYTYEDAQGDAGFDRAKEQREEAGWDANGSPL